MIAFRHADTRFPFLWEEAAQPPARWHGPGGGPVQYMSDVPDAAWAEFLRHEEIRDPADLAGVRRAMWAVRLPDETLPRPELSRAVTTGGLDTYRRCRAEADRLRATGARGLVAPSAALRSGAASGWQVEGGLRRAKEADGHTIVLFGAQPDVVGWEAAATGRPGPELLALVRHLNER